MKITYLMKSFAKQESPVTKKWKDVFSGYSFKRGREYTILKTMQMTIDINLKV
jgi:hypothetical protein